jgi:hypothetical protein
MCGYELAFVYFVFCILAPASVCFGHWGQQKGTLFDIAKNAYIVHMLRAQCSVRLLDPQSLTTTILPGR